MSGLVLLAMITWSLTASISYSVIVPFLPREFKNLGIPEHLYGYIFAAHSFSSMIWSFVCGYLLTKYGRRIIVVIGVISIGTTMISFGFIPYISPYPLLITVWFWIRALGGISASTIYTSWYSIIAITYKENQTKYLGYLEASAGLSVL